MTTLTTPLEIFTERLPPRLRRNHIGHLTLHCGPSRRRKLKVWVLLRLRHGFRPLHENDDAVVVRGKIRLRVCIDASGDLSVIADSGAGDVFLRRLRRGWWRQDTTAPRQE